MKKFLIAIALALPVLAGAQTKADREACAARDPAVDRAACLKEMVNARAEKTLVSPSDEQLRANALKRCDNPLVDRRTCIVRVLKGRTTGDVDKGGTITELRQIVPAK